jgi:hypothetical protein
MGETGVLPGAASGRRRTRFRVSAGAALLALTLIAITAAAFN